MSKRGVAAGVVALTIPLLLSSCSGVSSGQGEYPSDTVEVIVPFEAGGATDLITRAFAGQLEKKLDAESVVVINRPESSTAVGASEVANAEPDGHKLFIGTTTTFVTTPMVQDVPYSADDFQGVVGLVDQPYMVVGPSDGPFRSIEDVAGADGRLTYGVTAVGNNTHLAMGDFLAKSGVQGQAVPFESAQEALTAAAGGQVDVATVDLNIAAPQVEGGNVRGLAVTSSERVAQFPDVPTLMESGVDTQPFVGRFSLVGPKGMPPQVVDTLRQASKAALASPEFEKFRKRSYLSEPEYVNGSAWMNQMVPQVRQATQQAFSRLNVAAQS